jgi:hypothetical protein
MNGRKSHEVGFAVATDIRRNRSSNEMPESAARSVRADSPIMCTLHQIRTALDLPPACAAPLNESTSMPTPAQLFAGLFFGLIGLVGFNYGRKNMLWRPVVIGLALMVFPYVVSNVWLLYAVGGSLCATLYFWRE